ncbi:MAG: hypothetical protein GY941_02980, partial [Planctomycetes bacterium]|nr:hypothetical protein [Planctomycetota bacterium]
QGVAEFKEKEETSTLDIEELKAQMNHGTLNADSCYQAFKEMGIDYGEGQRGIREIYQGENQVLARLSLPSSVQDTQSEYVLHPSLMDSALQSSIGLMLKNSTLPNSSETPPGIGKWTLGINKWPSSIGRWTLRPSLPFALELLEILAPCTSEMYAWVRYSDGSVTSGKVQKLDIDLCDKQANVCTKMRGFSSRLLEGRLGTLKQKPVANTTHEETRIDLQSFVPVWDPIAPRIQKRVSVSSETKILLLGANQLDLGWIQKSYTNTCSLELPSQSTIEDIQEKLKSCPFDHLVWIAPDAFQTTDIGSMVEQQEQGVLEVFRIIKVLLNLGYVHKEIEWTIITSNTQLVKKRDSIEADHAGLLGLIGSLAKEFPHWRLRLL